MWLTLASLYRWLCMPLDVRPLLLIVPADLPCIVITGAQKTSRITVKIPPLPSSAVTDSGSALTTVTLSHRPLRGTQ